MGRRIPIEVGEHYHLYNRGVDKRNIFTNTYEHKRFVLLLYLCNSQKHLNMEMVLAELTKGPSFTKGRSFGDLFLTDRGERIASIGAYCLMPNHFHLLVKETKEGGITEFMRKLGTAYSAFFNASHERSGALFEGRYKSRRANSDTYLRYLYSYIHLNPVKLVDPQWKENGLRNRKAARAYLDTYEFSSFLDYRGDTRPQTAILNKEDFPDYFGARADFESHVDDFLTSQEDMS